MEKFREMALLEMDCVISNNHPSRIGKWVSPLTALNWLCLSGWKGFDMID